MTGQTGSYSSQTGRVGRALPATRRSVPTGGEAVRRQELTLHDPNDEGHTTLGDILDKKWPNMVGSVRPRRPRWHGRKRARKLDERERTRRARAKQGPYIRFELLDRRNGGRRWDFDGEVDLMRPRDPRPGNPRFPVTCSRGLAKEGSRGKPGRWMSFGCGGFGIRGGEPVDSTNELELLKLCSWWNGRGRS